jgi:hypothetical protein
VPARDERQETTESLEVVHGAHRADVSLEVGLHVRAEPEGRCARACEGFRVATAHYADPARFPRREGEKLQSGCPSRHRLGDVRHQGRLPGSGEKPLSHPARDRVDAAAHVVERFGHVLDLVKDSGKSKVIQEPLRIAAKAIHDIRVLQQVIARGGKNSPEEAGLARTPRPCQDHGREVPGSAQKLGSTQEGLRFAPPAPVNYQR